MIRLSKYVVIGAIVSATSSIGGLGVSLCGRRYPDDFASLPIRAALTASDDPYTDITYPMIRLAGSRAWLIGGRLAPLSIVGFSYAQKVRRISCDDSRFSLRSNGTPESHQVPGKFSARACVTELPAKLEQQSQRAGNFRSQLPGQSTARHGSVGASVVFQRLPPFSHAYRQSEHGTKVNK